MRWRRTIVLVAGGCVLVALIAVAGFVALRYYDIQATRILVVQRLEAITGRQVAIRGDFDLAASLTPTLVAEGLALANAPWGSQPHMLEAERIEIELQIVPLLLRGDLLIDRLVVSGADLLLETDARRRANWRFGEGAGPAVSAEERRAFLLDEVTLESSSLGWHDMATDRTETVLLERLGWQADSASGELELSGAGRFESVPFELSGRLGPLADLFAADDPYPVALDVALDDLDARLHGQVRPDGGVRVEIEATGDELAMLAEAWGVEMAPFGPYAASGTLQGDLDGLALGDVEATAGDQAARLTLTGSIGDVLALSALDLAATVEGSDLAALSPLARVSLPESGPYRLAARLAGSAMDLRVEDLEARLLDSAIGGRLAIHRAGRAVPLIEGELTADRLDLDRMLAPAEAVVADRQAAAPAETEDGLFPDQPLPLEWLGELEADLVIRADELRLENVEFTDASASLMLRDGLLSVQDVALQVTGGSIAGNASLEAGERDDAQDLAEVTVRLSARDIEIGQVLKDVTAAERVTGEIAIDLDIDGTGRSIDALLASLDGNAAIMADGGTIYDAPLERLVADLDILRALPPFWRDDDSVEVNCLVSEFDITDGVARTEALLDTRRMTLLGRGTVNLAEETLDLALRPVPKNQKLSTLAVPVDIEGSLSEPRIEPRTGTAVGQAVRGVLGGLLVPLNQLTALFGEETADACAAALGQARERREGAGEPAEGGP